MNTDTPDVRQAWGPRRTAAAVGVAVVIAGLGGAAVYAASGNASPQFPAGAHAPPAGDGRPAGLSGQVPHGPDAEHGPALHGEVVVADGPGGFVTMMSQSGTVTATTADSLTVRSADGYTLTWTTVAGQGARFGVDDSVLVRGEQRATGSSPVVTEVLDPQRTPR